jgi:hypothetical protein
LLGGYVLVRAALQTGFKMFDPDEALEMLPAASLLDGKLPYLGALSHRGPLLTVLYAIPCALFGRDDWVAVHWFCVALFVALGVWLQACVARATNERVGLLTLASLVLLATLRIPSEEVWAVNSDFLMGLVATAGLASLMGARAGTRPGPEASAPRAYAFAGVMLSCAFLTKQNGLTFAAVPVAFVVMRDRAGAVRKLAWLAAGLAAPVLVAFGVYAWASALPRAWYFFYQYNRSYAASGFTSTPLSRWLLWPLHDYLEFILLAVAGAVAFRRAGTGRFASAWVFAALWGAAAAATAAAPGAPWDNYLWAVHPVAALLAALGADALVEQIAARPWRPRSRRAATLGVLGLPGLVAAHGFWLGEVTLNYARWGEVGGAQFPLVQRKWLVELVDEASTESDTLYVTGYAPEMYLLCHRRPASRHVVSNFVEGVYPGRFRGTTSKLVPRFFDELRADLAQNRPRVVIDACKLGFTCHPHSALTEALPSLLTDYHVMSNAPPGVYVRND